MSLPENDGPNLLGALALHVDTLMRAAVTGPAGAGGALAEAIVVVKDQPGVTAEWLAQVLGLSQPGSAHVVRRLVQAGWIERRSGADARSRALHLTPAGEAAAAQILAARGRALEEAMAPLTAEQRDQLAAIARAILRPQAHDDRCLARLCRLCDRTQCTVCPVHAGYLEAKARP
jgi:DNA-binding MarR family transcriptional regulator